MTWLHGDVAAPATVVRALAWCRAFTALSLAYNLFLLWLVASRFAELRRLGASKRSGKRRLVFWMLVNLLANTPEMIGGAFALSRVASDETVCDVLLRLNPLLFAVSVWATYWVLMIRAEATLDRGNKLHMLVFWHCRLALLVGFPVLILVGLGLFKGRVLFEEGLCTQEVPANVALVFMLLDAGLSVQLLLLFYIPVRQHMRESQGMTDKLKTESALLHAKALRSLKLSLVQMTSTFAVQLAGVVTPLLFDDASEPDLAYWRYVRFTLYGVDVLTNTSCMLLMSNAWKPRAWRRRGLARCFRVAAASSPDSTDAASGNSAKVVPAVDSNP